jgi:hypothetical protein
MYIFITVVIIILSILFFKVHKLKKLYQNQELSLDKEILKKDYEEIIKYISETYNLNIHKISFTLLTYQTKKLIRFEIKLDKYPLNHFEYLDLIGKEITLYITEKEFELQNKYKAEEIFTFFSSFEQEEQERIYSHLPNELNFLKQSINNKDIWIIKNVFYTRIVVFFYSNYQLPDKTEKERISNILKEYIFSSLKKFDINNILDKNEIIIEFDTKENFDTNFESNWYFYIL